MFVSDKLCNNDVVPYAISSHGVGRFEKETRHRA